VVAPNNAFLYVGTQEGVFLYTIASDGTLTEGNDDTVVYLNASNPTVASLAVDSTNSWLLIASQGSNQLAALAINSSTGIPPSVTPASATLSYAGPVQMSISPANNNVVVALGTGGTNVFGFNASNTSTPWGTEVSIRLHVATSSIDASVAANAVAFDTTSTYILIGETLQSTTQSPTNDLLRLIPVASLNADKADYPVGRGPTAILADLTGAYIYVANSTDNTISGFSISAGALTALADSPYPTAKTSVALLEDNSKSYVLDAGSGTNPDLWVYNFDTVAPGDLDVKTTATTGTTDPSLANAMAVTH
jgi:6-phosphogluconolactonase (cycloisomerase 2 family)